MTVLWKRVLKWTAWLLGGAIAVVAVLCLAVLLINLRDQPPSEFALRLENSYRNRPAVADADNAYIYVMGFAVAPDADPYGAGLRRFQWLKHQAEHPEDRAQPDPLSQASEHQLTRPPAVQTIVQACGRNSSNCPAALEGSDSTLVEWLTAEQWRLDRYFNLLRRPGWLEVIPSDATVPLPAYAPVMEGQRLLLAKAHYLAGQKDASGVRELLEQDARFWRRVLASSDTLVTKMIAVAALTRNFDLGNLALRRLPAEMQLESLPAAWRAPFTDEERSLQRCFTGEWVFGRNVLGEALTHASELPAEDWGLMHRLNARAQALLFQAQDTSNQSAEMLIRATEALHVPLEQFIEGLNAAEAVFKAPADRVGSLSNLYNPIGDLLVGIGSTSYVDYPPRVADLEGVRRAAVLATELRTRKIDQQNIATELAASHIRTPYKSEPFIWDAEEGAIVFIGLVPGERGRHPFKY